LNFLKAIYGDDYKEIGQLNEGIDRYFSETRDFIGDFKLAIQWMNKSNLCVGTINIICGGLRKFFSRHGYRIADEDWKDMKLTLIPANVVSTQDVILTKEQFRDVLKYLSIHSKAIALFLLSTGCRIGETLKLDIQNVDLDADPPEARITPATSKKGVGGRTVFMSYEARDAIRDWLKIKETKKKAGGQGEYSKDLVFGGIEEQTFGKAWNRALKRANLAKQDSVSAYGVYHVHTLRKFFSTAMSEAGLQESVIHAWMGHKGYLDDAYKRYTKDALRQMYKDHMSAVTIFEQGSTSEFRKKLEAIQKDLDAKNEQLQAKNKEVAKFNDVMDALGIDKNKPQDDRYLEFFRITLKGQTDVQEREADLKKKLAEQETKRVEINTLFNEFNDSLNQPIPQPTQSEPPKAGGLTEKPIVVEDHEQTRPPALAKRPEPRLRMGASEPMEIPSPRPQMSDDKEWITCPGDVWRTKEDCEKCGTTNPNQYNICISERAKNPNGLLFRMSKPKP
jgi:site-specific recombinase XerD